MGRKGVHAPNFIDVTGKTFEYLTVLGYSRTTQGVAYWKVRCRCGIEKEIRYEHLLRVKSCGCYQRDHPARLDHGMAGTRVHRAWIRMRQRCLNPKDPDYPDWGGRGITICERWESFDAFHADMGDPPPGRSLDRIDNECGYSPENCRWATQRQQQNNKRSCTMLTHHGRTQSTSDWAREVGIAPGTLAYRIRSGWPVNDALSLAADEIGRGPRTGAVGKKIAFNGREQTIHDWAKETGIPKGTITARLCRGWSVERALTEPLFKR